MDYPLVMASRAAGHRTRKLAMRMLDEIGLFAGQEVVLLELAERGELNQAALAVALDIEPPSVAGILAKLEGAGLVTRTASGREKLVTLTEAGHEAAAQAREVYAVMEGQLAAGLSPREIDRTVTALRRVSDSAETALRAANGRDS